MSYQNNYKYKLINPILSFKHWNFFAGIYLFSMVQKKFNHLVYNRRSFAIISIADPISIPLDNDK